MPRHRADAEGLQAAVRSADAENAGLRRELDERSREVEQLTTLSLKGDATVQARAGGWFGGVCAAEFAVVLGFIQLAALQIIFPLECLSDWC